MADLREQVLDRLAAVLRGISGVVAVLENQERGDDARLPMIILLDGGEEVEEGDLRPGRPANAPLRVTASPQVFFTVAGKPEELRAARELLRRKILKAVLFDAKLTALTGEDPKGRVRYLGCATGLARGRELYGDMGLDFAFRYVFRPNDL